MEKIGTIDKPKFAREFFTDIKYKKVGGEQLTAKCMFCTAAVTSTGTTRLKDHLSSCVLCPPRVKKPFQLLVKEASNKRKLKDEQMSLHLEEAAAEMRKAKEAKQELVQLGLRDSLKSAEVSVADRAIAKWFYGNGIPVFMQQMRQLTRCTKIW